jgi:prepilin-type N-terminal cleavage/methylation domain-containing protein
MSMSQAGKPGSAKSALLSRGMRNERGFTLVEVGIVVIIIGIMLLTASLAYFNATRRTEVVTVAEQIKEDLRRVYSLTDSGNRTSGPNGPRDRYKITFNNAGENPPNTYRIEKSTDGGNNWADVDPTRQESNKRVTVGGHIWIQPASQGDAQLTYTAKMITFISKGSIMQTDPAGNKTVTVSSSSQGTNAVITINDYGSLQ